MSKHLNLSKDQSLPLEVATQATSIFGIRGSGKTNTAGVIAEELLRLGQPVVIIESRRRSWMPPIPPGCFSVVRLLLWRCPSTVAGFVVPVIVDAINRMTCRRAFSHVAEERFETRSPAGADADSAAAIEIKMLVGR